MLCLCLTSIIEISCCSMCGIIIYCCYRIYFQIFGVNHTNHFQSFQYSTFFNFQCLRWNLLCKYIRWGLSVMLFYGSLQLEVLSPMIWDGCSFNYKVAEKKHDPTLYDIYFGCFFSNKQSSIRQIFKLFCCIWEFMKATITSWR